MRPNHKYFIKSLIGLLFVYIYCEYLIYFIVQIRCDWPELQPENEDVTIKAHIDKPVRVMVITDIHLLGSRRGFWIDNMLREGQMYRAFQIAMAFHKPELVFVLGDITDDGMYSNDDEFQDYVRRFNNIFTVPDGTTLYLTVGNHDIGFHDEVSPNLNQRFFNGFNTSAVKLVSVRGNHFVLVNSIALHDDGCFLCKPVEKELDKVQKILQCTKGTNIEKCNPEMKLDLYSKPILIQHYPLYRPSDAVCDDFDSAPLSEKYDPFKEKRECLSQEATIKLLNQTEPRLVMGGHTHHGCTRKLPIGEGLELTISSFNKRSKNNPNYLLGVFTPNNYAYNKCELPKESTAILLYTLGVIIFIICSIDNFMLNSRINRKYCSMNLLTKLPCFKQSPVRHIPV